VGLCSYFLFKLFKFIHLFVYVWLCMPVIWYVWLEFSCLISDLFFLRLQKKQATNYYLTMMLPATNTTNNFIWYQIIIWKFEMFVNQHVVLSYVLYCPMSVNVRSDCHFFLFSIVLPKFQRRTTSSWDRSVKVYTPIPLGIKTSILRSPDDNSTLDCNERQFSFNIHNFCYSMTRIYLYSAVDSFIGFAWSYHYSMQETFMEAVYGYLGDGHALVFVGWKPCTGHTIVSRCDFISTFKRPTTKNSSTDSTLP